MSTCSLCSTAVGPDDVTCPVCGGLVNDDSLWAKPPESVGDTWVSPPPPPSPEQDATTVWAAPTDPTGPFGSSPPPAAAPDGTPPPGHQPPYGTGPYGPTPGGAAPPYGAPYGGAPPYGAPYGGPAPYGAYPYGVPVYVPPPPKVPTEGLAIASLVTSIAGLVLAGSCLFPVLACPVGAILGHVAMRRIDESGKQGRGMALAGAIVGWVGTALLVLGILFFVIVAATGEL